MLRDEEGSDRQNVERRGGQEGVIKIEKRRKEGGQFFGMWRKWEGEIRILGGFKRLGSDSAGGDMDG